MPYNPNYAMFRFLLGDNNFICGLIFIFLSVNSFLIDAIGKKKKRKEKTKQLSKII